LDLNGADLPFPYRLVNLLGDDVTTLADPHLHLTLAPSTVRAFRIEPETA